MTDQILEFMSAKLDQLQQANERLEQSSYQELGAGGREYDQSVLDTIAHNEKKMELIDGFVYDWQQLAEKS